MDQSPPFRNDHADRIARVLRHVDAHLDGDLGLDALADVAALSRFHFSRVFRAQTGEGVAEGVRRMRLNRAAVLVVSTDAPMRAIARRCGFGHVGRHPELGGPQPLSFGRLRRRERPDARLRRRRLLKCEWTAGEDRCAGLCK